MSFKDILKKLNAEKPLKILKDDTKLPYVFDLYWDAKTFEDLRRFDLLRNQDVLRLLAEHGYDRRKLK